VSRGISWHQNGARIIVAGAVLAAALGLAEGVCAATTSEADLSYMRRIAAVESSGRTDLVNSFGYAGQYQTGVAGAVDAGWAVRPAGCSGNNWNCVQWTDKAQSNGVSSLSSFLGNGAAQNAMEVDLIGRQRGYMSYYGLDQYVGQTVNGRVMTEQDILAGIHFQGAGGMKAYLESGGNYDSTDGNGLKMSAYLNRVNGSDGTGGTVTAAAKGYTPSAGKKAVGCSDPVRQRMAGHAQNSAVAMVQRAVSIQQLPVPTLQTCVATLIDRMTSMKALSAGSGPTIDDVLKGLQQQACSVLKREFDRTVAQSFDPQVFMQATPNVSAILGGAVPTMGGWGR
jgi:hypothetical protein